MNAIRAACAADAPVLARLRLALRGEMGGGSEDAAAFLARCTRWMAERLAAEVPWRCWLAEDAGEVQAAIWVQLIEKIPNPDGHPELHAYVTNFYVLPAARGRGLGGRLLRRALDGCRSLHVDAVILWPSPRSRPLYRRHGFAASDDLLQLRLHP